MNSPVPVPDTSAPLVSVVIPTLRRAHLLLDRALRTALSQTLKDIEVIVVIDGPDAQTREALQGLEDQRLRVLPQAVSVGGSEARNIGIRAARAEWIALLDDDDEWLPHKLEQQLAVAQRSAGRVIVACPWIERTPRGDTTLPVRWPDAGEPLGDYVLARRTSGERASGLVSSLLFTSRDLLLDVPFHTGLAKHQDWDWLLRAGARPDVHLAHTDDVGAVWYYEEPRPSVSRTLDWRLSLDWAEGHRRRGTMSPRALAGFLNSHVSTSAQLTRDHTAILPLLRAFARSRPRAFEWVRFLSGWLVPLETRRSLRGALTRVSKPGRDPSTGDVPVRVTGTSGLRVALIDPLDTGHHTSYAALLADGLTRAGHHVQVIGSARLVQGVLDHVPGVRTEVLPLYAGDMDAYYALPRLKRELVNIRFFQAALRQARRQDAEIAHILYLDSYTQSFLAALIGLRWHLGSMRVRATLHWLYFLRAYKAAPGHPLGERFHLTVLTLLGVLGVRIGVHSRTLAEQLKEHVPGLPVDIVPYFAERPRLDPIRRAAVRAARRADLHLGPDVVALLAFGGTRHDKGSDVAIRALAHLPSHVHLMVVGPARTFDAHALMRLAETCGVGNRVHFRVEYVPDEEVEEYFVAADCVVLPYRRVFAGQSGPLLIAAALGVPVVASDVGVLAETVRAYDLGLLFTPEDDLALAEAVRQVPDLPPRGQTSRFQHDHAPEQFTLATVESYRKGRR